MKKLILLFLLFPCFISAQIELLGSMTSGNSGTDVWEYIDPNNGNVYAIVGGNGMSVVDVTDPTTPFEVAHLPAVPGFDVKVWDHYVYCATGGGGNARVIDISDPTNPQLAGVFPSAHNFFIDDQGFLYASSPGVKIYDLNPDPVNPTLIAQVGSEGHDVTVRGDLMIDCHGFAGTNLYDVSDRTSPVLISSITDPSITYHHQGDISTDGNYLYICDELGNHPQADISVWDISDISNPVRVNDVADPDATPHNMYVIGDYGYTSYYTAGLKIFDITDPSQLVLADSFDTNGATGEGFAGAFGVYPSPLTGNIYINDDTGVYVFGFSELLDNPTFESNGLAVYPNPSGNRVTISSENMAIDSIQVVSILGQQVLDVQGLNGVSSYELQVAGWRSGIYLVRINDTIVKKLSVK